MENEMKDKLTLSEFRALNKKSGTGKRVKQKVTPLYSQTVSTTFHLPVEPLSVNDAWKGQRFKTKEYKSFEQSVRNYMRGENKIPRPPYCAYITVGFSNKGSDLDNPTKMILDIMQAILGFNDNQVYRLVIDKTIVQRGGEFFKFTLAKHKEKNA